MAGGAEEEIGTTSREKWSRQEMIIAHQNWRQKLDSCMGDLRLAAVISTGTGV